ncbi:MAG: hypothetical protein ACRC4M_04845 [Mycoplasma sp.]
MFGKVSIQKFNETARELKNEGGVLNCIKSMMLLVSIPFVSVVSIVVNVVVGAFGFLWSLLVKLPSVVWFKMFKEYYGIERIEDCLFNLDSIIEETFFCSKYWFIKW